MDANAKTIRNFLIFIGLSLKCEELSIKGQTGVAADIELVDRA